AIDDAQLALDLGPRAQAAVDDDLELGELALQPMRFAVAKRGNLPILLRREPFQDGVARMHDEAAAASLRHLLDESAHEAVVLDTIDADAMLHRHRQRACSAHCAHALGNQVGLRHETGTERSALHALARTADVEIDLVVAIALGEARNAPARPARSRRAGAQPDALRG